MSQVPSFPKIAAMKVLGDLNGGAAVREGLSSETDQRPNGQYLGQRGINKGGNPRILPIKSFCKG